MLAPSPPNRIATWIRDAVARSVPFKCTAGLHQAVRHTDATTGFEHHGYLNILLATARALSGADAAEVEAVVAQRDAQALAEEVARSSDRVMTSARDAFTSYGSCSILEPLSGPGRAAPPHARRLISRTAPSGASA